MESDGKRLVSLGGIKQNWIAMLAEPVQKKGHAQSYKKLQKPPKPPRRSLQKPSKPKRKPSAAFMKPVQPDEALAKIVGDKPLPRTELTKKLWAYIRKAGLQDSKKKTQINADANLKEVFNGKKQVSMFEMTKLVSGHLKK